MYVALLRVLTLASLHSTKVCLVLGGQSLSHQPQTGLSGPQKCLPLDAHLASLLTSTLACLIAASAQNTLSFLSLRQGHPRDGLPRPQSAKLLQKSKASLPNEPTQALQFGEM